MTLQAYALAVLTFLILSGGLMVFYGAFTYRGVVAAKREVDHSFSDLDRVLQERFDALGELMQIFRGYIPRDSPELRAVAEIRSAWAIAADNEAKLKSAADFIAALKNLMAEAQAHPVLQPAEEFSRFEKRLSAIENEMSDRREQYNSAIRRFNQRLLEFPGRWLAGVTGFTLQPYFMAPAGEQPCTFAATHDPPDS
jgi:LemA protein